MPSPEVLHKTIRTYYLSHVYFVTHFLKLFLKMFSKPAVDIIFHFFFLDLCGFWRAKHRWVQGAHQLLRRPCIIRKQLNTSSSWKLNHLELSSGGRAYKWVNLDTDLQNQHLNNPGLNCIWGVDQSHIYLGLCFRLQFQVSVQVCVPPDRYM